MKKLFGLHIAYWGLILTFLTLFFGTQWASYTLAFYFASFLLPVVMGTSYFFNGYLVPKYLLTGKYRPFLLYFSYLLVASLYLEMMVTMASLALIADYQLEAINLKGISIFILGITLYLIVLATGFVRLLLQLKNKNLLVETLQSESDKNKQEQLVIRSDRKNQQVLLNDLLYIESLNDYVKVVTVHGEFETREKITKLHEQLPTYFVRIHRSFLVNAQKVQSYNQSEVVVNGITLPISRTYKKKALEVLQK